MARTDSLYNGSAAYDFYSSSAAREIVHPGLPEERSVPQPHVRVKAKAAIAPVAVIGMVITACMLILVVFGYVQLYEATEKVGSLESELSNLRSEQVVLESLYEGSIDLDYIEEQAESLGYAVPEREQIVYLNLAGADKAEIYHVEKENVFQRVFHALKSSASGLVEYLS